MEANLINNSLFQIVVLEKPHLKMSSQLGRHYFSEMCNLKLCGYRNHHSEKALPLDHYDYISNHFLVCEKRNDGFHKVISGYRSLSFKECLEFDVKFDLLEDVENHGFKLTRDELQKLLSDTMVCSHDIYHNSRWTALPEYVKSKSQILFIQELVYTLLYYGNKGKSHEWLSLGVKDLNTDKFFYRAGGKDFGSCSNFFLSLAYGMKRELTIIHGDKDRNEHKILKYAEKHKILWEERIII